MIEALPDVVALLNQDYVCLYLSPAVETVLGYPRGELLGRPADVVVRPEHLSVAWGSRAEAEAGSTDCNVVQVLTRDGRYIWMEGAVCRITDPRDGRKYYLMRSRDASAEIALREQLVAAHQRYTALMETMSEAVIVLDHRQVITSMSRQAVELLGWPEDRLLGRNLFDALDLRDAKGHRSTRPDGGLLERLARGERVETWRSVLRGDGRLAMLNVRVVPLPGPAGQAPSLVCAFSDGLGPRVEDEQPQIDRARVRAAVGVTRRQGDVLDLLAAGHDVREIARRMAITEHSVRHHLKGLMGRLGVRSQVQLLVAAARRGLVDLSAAP
jgi:PAS domain S-box-containing protein